MVESFLNRAGMSGKQESLADQESRALRYHHIHPIRMSCPRLPGTEFRCLENADFPSTRASRVQGQTLCIKKGFAHRLNAIVIQKKGFDLSTNQTSSQRRKGLLFPGPSEGLISEKSCTAPGPENWVAPSWSSRKCRQYIFLTVIC